MPSGITGTPLLSASPTGYPGTNSQLSPAIQVIWSKEILFQSMPVLRFEQFAVKKTELGIQPGLQVNFMRYNNLGDASQLVEGVRMQTAALTASQYAITVAEQGYAVAVSELLLNSSFDDVMASSSRLLGRNMAKYLDGSARDTLYQASSAIFGYALPTGAITPLSPYDAGVVAANYAALAGTQYMSVNVTKDAVETLATKNVPRIGETYVAFIDPHQSRRIRDNPEFIEMTKYAAAGNFMIGEIGRLNDTVYIETTQVRQYVPGAGPAGGTGQGNGGVTHGAIYLGDNAFGHAISLPVELRDGGVLDFGREHALCWYSIWGFGLITDQSVVLAWTN
jgi:N4-gp56 family major capsid protein